jgi:hypothetical protein
LEEINDRRLRMPESNNGPTKDEREMMSWVKKEYGLEDEKPSDLMRWSLQARHAVLKRDVQIGELKAENERLRRVAEAATSLIEYGYGDDRMKLKNALRELEDSDE